VRQTARNDADRVLSYDYRNLAADLSKVKAIATPAFAVQMTSTIAQSVQPLATKYHVVSVFTSPTARYETGGCQQPAFIVTGQQVLTDTQLSAPRVVHDVIIVTLRYGGHGYRVDDVVPTKKSGG
jgi:hypothetical protein